MESMTTDLGSFEILRPLGAGGMGEVFLARDPRLGRQVAIKVITPELLDDGRAQARFRREARLLASVSHPYVVQVFDVGHTPDGRQMLVMEYLEGQTLADLLARGPISSGRALVFARELAEGLGAMHRAGLVHRDLKAQNVMLTASGHLKILDFGLAKSRERRKESTISVEGHLAGTFSAMSPEQVQGRELDPRSDLFSLGILLYELVTGAHPFRGETDQDTMVRICRDVQAPARDLAPSIPWAFSRLLDRLLAKLRDERPRDTQQLLFELDRLDLQAEPPAVAARTHDEPTRSSAASQPPVVLDPRRPRRAAVGVALAVLVVLGLWLGAGLGQRSAPLSVAVLEPTNLRQQESLDWYSAAVARALSAQLAVGDELQVIDPDWVVESQRHLGLAPGESNEQLLELLGADLVLTGSFLPSFEEPEIEALLELRLRRKGETVPLWSLAVSIRAETLWRALADLSHEIRQTLRLVTIPPGQALAAGASWPREPEALELLGRAQALIDRLEGVGAIPLLEQAAELAPDSARIQEALSVAYTQEGRSGLALEAARRSLALTDPLDEKARHQAEARVREAERDWAAAAEALSRLVQLEPGTVGGRLRLARALLSAEQLDASEAVLDDLGRLPGAEGDPRPWLLRSWLAFERSDYAVMIRSAREAEQLASSLGAPGLEGEALMRRAIGHFERGEREPGAELAAKARERLGDAGDRLRALRATELFAYQLHGLERLEEAETLYRQAVEGYLELGNRAGFQRALESLGVVLSRQGRLGEAEPYFDRASQLRSEFDAEIPLAINEVNRAASAMVAGNLELAEEVLLGTLETFTELGRPTYRAYALTNLGEIDFLRAHLAPARERHRRALELRQLFGEPTEYNRLWLARIAAAAGDLETAEAEFSDLATQGNLEAAFERARIAAWQGQGSEARERLRAGLQTLTSAAATGAAARPLILALDLEARLLLELGETEAARRTRVRATDLAIGREDLELELRLRITGERLAWSLDPSTAGQSLEELARLQQRAERADFRLMAFEARLEAGWIRLQQDGTSEGLEELLREVDGEGLGGLALRARHLLDSPS